MAMDSHSYDVKNLSHLFPLQLSSSHIIVKTLFTVLRNKNNTAHSILKHSEHIYKIIENQLKRHHKSNVTLYQKRCT